MDAQQKQKYTVIVERPQGGTENFEFYDVHQAQELAMRFKQKGVTCKVQTKRAMNQLWPSELKALKKAAFYTSFTHF
jgi:hypothetical protein